MLGRTFDQVRPVFRQVGSTIFLCQTFFIVSSSNFFLINMFEQNLKYDHRLKRQTRHLHASVLR